MKKIRWEGMKSYRGAILALILVCVALIVHEIFGDHGYLALRRQKKQYQALEQQIQQLQVENQKLEKQIKSLKSDPQAIEKHAREELHLARPGEIIYTLPENRESGTGNRESEVGKPKSAHNDESKSSLQRKD